MIKLPFRTEHLRRGIMPSAKSQHRRRLGLLVQPVGVCWRIVDTTIIADPRDAIMRAMRTWRTTE